MSAEPWGTEGDRLRASIANREDVIGDLRAEVTRLADTLGAIGRSVGAESCERDVILAAIRDRGEDAFRRGAEAMREAAARACYDRASALDEGVSDDEAATNDEGYGRFQEALALETTIRALPLPVEASPQPAQSIAAPATPDVPLSLADAAARARSAAAQRATCGHRWVTTLDGLRDICMRCPEVRRREAVPR